MELVLFLFIAFLVMVPLLIKAVDWFIDRFVKGK